MDTLFKYEKRRLIVGVLLVCACAILGVVDVWHSLSSIHIDDGDPFDPFVVTDESRLLRAVVLLHIAVAALIYVIVIVRRKRFSEKDKGRSSR